MGKTYILWMFKLLMRAGETRSSLNACFAFGIKPSHLLDFFGKIHSSTTTTRKKILGLQ